MYINAAIKGLSTISDTCTCGSGMGGKVIAA